MRVEILKNIFLNVSLLVLIAYLLTRIQLVRDFVGRKNNQLYPKLVLALLFGIIGILSTYTGVPVQGAIANTRVIGVVAGGILGGPIVGITAGVIAGLHRYAIDIGGFTAVACAVSTITEGLIGGVLSKYIKQGKTRWIQVGGVTMLAEIVQMAVILLIARPLDAAWQLVEVISLPMIFINSLGVVIFIGIFDSVFIEEDREAAQRIGLVMDIAEKCLPFLRKGLLDRENMAQAAEVILRESAVAAVLMTDRKQLLCCKGLSLTPPLEQYPLPPVAQEVIGDGQVRFAGPDDGMSGSHPEYKKLAAVCAPLTRGGEVTGTLMLLINKYKLTREAEYRFADGLAKLFSTQLELAEVEYQKKLLKRAELAALQSQINPHFLFNALSTITAFCREKPERARELLIVLSNYFRNTLQGGDYMISLQDELGHVDAYLELEKARFEERLQVVQDVPAGLACMVPSFTLQPLVENAVKHGAMKCQDGPGRVHIAARSQGEEVRITVSDNGSGIPEDIIEKLHSKTLGGQSVGMANVDKRMRSIYGDEYGLQVETGPSGSSVILRIPQTLYQGEGDSRENSSD